MNTKRATIELTSRPTGHRPCSDLMIATSDCFRHLKQKFQLKISLFTMIYLKRMKN